MTEIEALLKATIGEMERLLASKTVIGEPITAGGKTVIPLLSVGAGFGVGAGSGKGDEGMGGGAGGGFGMKPIAVIVIEEDAVRVEPVRKGGGSIIEQLADKVPQLIKKEIEEWEEGREEKKEKEAEEKEGEGKGRGKEKGKEKGKEIKVD
ncbi:spore germination protein GerW family protein [Methanotrichaceae archaeon M04Ac]|uniref:Spore germination protein GerW family protein n=1 Tax=Candidatus Methanocrinis alkalitolerans TaxID=3033395 RepID=A0ABT5XDK8_9EURY|nr:spore germination protein GerW family protein [Candidatus Methanocrinis alkalitolerans]MDF0592800.1 spore germination protein GerW family protein [Candidatus Methanocrinis alkalitolerans]